MAYLLIPRFESHLKYQNVTNTKNDEYLSMSGSSFDQFGWLTLWLLIVSVDVKHHAYLLYLIHSTDCP